MVTQPCMKRNTASDDATTDILIPAPSDDQKPARKLSTSDIDGRDAAAFVLLPTLLQYADIEEFYSDLVYRFRTHRVGNLHYPCCRGKHGTEDYILYGTYKRNVYDLVKSDTPNSRDLFDLEISSEPIMLHVQRICCKSCMKKGQWQTHALLLDLIVPYSHYSLRAILFFLFLYYNEAGSISLENFCSLHNIPPKTFRRWIQWLKKNAQRLRALKNTLTNAEKKAWFADFIKEMLDQYYTFVKLFVDILENTTLFQTHAPPDQLEILSGKVLTI